MSSEGGKELENMECGVVMPVDGRCVMLTVVESREGTPPVGGGALEMRGVTRRGADPHRPR